MADKHLLVEVSVDRAGDVYLSPDTTLRDLLDACRAAEEAGYPLDSKIQYGYMPHNLMDGLFVEKPTDWTRLPYVELKRLATAPSSTGTQAKAWSEIERRIMDRR